jgi:membrane protein implicated in regulation of membrane protease activity
MLEIWFIAAIFLVVLEVVLGFTIILLFASFASFIVGIVISFGLLDDADLVNQIGLFFAISVVASILLLRPLKRLIASRNRAVPVVNYVGQKVILQDESLTKGEFGSAKWSGTIVNIRLAEGDDGKTYRAGDILIVVDVVENIFIVKGDK